MKKIITTLVVALLAVGSISGIALGKGTRRPANDNLDAAAVVESLPFSTTVNLTGATLEPGEVQPSCAGIDGSVWYSFSVSEEGNVIGELSSSRFRSAAAIYERAADGSLIESACMEGTASLTTEFKAFPESLYLIQLGAAGKKQGIVDLSLRLSTWRDVSLFDYTFHRETEEQRIPLVHVKGEPRTHNPSMYDVTVQVSEQEPARFGILTFGLVTRKVEAELLRIPASTTDVRIQITGRYDSSQYTCAVDDGGDVCYAGAPLKDLDWLTGGDGSRAELVIAVSAQRNGEVLVERTQSVPYAGQVLGLIP